MPQAMAVFRDGILLYPATPAAYNGQAVCDEQNKQ